MKLHESIASAIERMEEMNRINEALPGYDCGSCGSPTCLSFAEDIVRGYLTENDCIYMLKDTLKVMAQKWWTSQKPSGNRGRPFDDTGTFHDP